MIVVWRNLWLFGLWGPPPIPLFRNDIEEGLYCSLIKGLIFVTLVTLTATVLYIFGAGGVSCHISTDRE